MAVTADTLMMWLLFMAIGLQGFFGCSASDDDTGVAHRQWMREPTVVIAVLVRNKAHTLPWFLYYLQNLDYPKQRIRLWYLHFLFNYSSLVGVRSVVMSISV